MTTVEQAADVIHRGETPRCKDGCPFPDCCYASYTGERELAAAQALADAGVLCTPAERAVVDAAIAETNAEHIARNTSRRALQARPGSHLLADEHVAHHNVAKARQNRADAVRRLHEQRGDQQ